MHFRPALLLAALLLAFIIPPPAEAQAQAQAMAQNGERKFSRVLFFYRDDQEFSIPCQYMVSYGAPEWKDEHDEALKQAAKGARLRLGKDAWATFETNRPLTIGGVKVPVGYYHLAIEKMDEGKLGLVLLDQAKVREKHLDPFQSDKTEGGIVVPFVAEKSEKPTDELTIRLQTKKETPKDGTLLCAWGPHRLTAAITVEM